MAALNGPLDFIAENLKAFDRRRQLVVNGLNAIDGISCAMPDGAFYVYPNIAGIIGRKTPDGTVISDDSAFVSYLLEAAGVACVQGVAFGLSPHFRISYATSDTNLQTSLDRISEAVSKLS